MKTNGQEQTCQMNQQNWNKTRSLGKAVHKAGQERYIYYVQETLWASVLFQSRPPMMGVGELERMVPEEWNGQRTCGWSPLRPKALTSVP